MKSAEQLPSQTLGQVELRKGRLAEERVLAAVNANAPTCLSWFRSARLATAAEDRRGIDIVIETKDIGLLYLQVKSSRAAARKYRHTHQHVVISTVVVHFYESLENIWCRVFPKMIEIRKEVLRRRSQN